MNLGWEPPISGIYTATVIPLTACKACRTIKSSLFIFFTVAIFRKMYS
jgi:hypothetical protein